MKYLQKGYTLVELLVGGFIFIVLPLAVWGWVWNIVKLIGMGLDPITGLLIVRVIGIFVPPLGAVVGFI